MWHSFTTGSASRAEHSRRWHVLARAELVEFEKDARASICGGDFGRLRLCLVSMGRHRVVQPNSAEYAPFEPTLKFLFQEEGIAMVRQGGLEHAIHPGQWCALRNDLHYEIEAPAHSRQLFITLPCGVVPNPGRELAWWRKPRNFLHGPARVLHASASASVLSGETLTQEDCEKLGAQLAQMIEMTIHADYPDSFPDVREERRMAILEYIDSRLNDPALGVQEIARKFGCSSRTLHKLFENEEHTVVRTIWERRLERCREDLIDPAMQERSITEIAYRWGFSDSQHFSRAFKNRYGVKPSEYRRLHQLN